jgi:hypothetical protein
MVYIIGALFAIWICAIMLIVSTGIVYFLLPDMREEIKKEILR